MIPSCHGGANQNKEAYGGGVMRCFRKCYTCQLVLLYN